VPRDVIPAPQQTVCQCKSMINMVPFTSDHTVMIPVDIHRDPDGDLIVVGSRAGYTVRPIQAGEEVEVRFRRQAHWKTCPHVSRWRDVMRSIGIGGPAPSHDSTRAGPCARCHQRHPWRYGGPVASPVCDRCRSAAGEPLMGEYD
jgi:hypothetical protein